MANRMNPDLYNQLKGSLTPEQLEQYKKTGEEMYNSVDFNTAGHDPLAEAVAYIKEALKSGLDPSYLDEDEQKAMENGVGKDWKSKFSVGFKKE